MKAFPNRRPFTLSGRWSYRIRNLYLLFLCAIRTTSQRILRGPLLPSWSWAFETGTHYLREQFRAARELPDIEARREFLDALVPYSEVLDRVELSAVHEPVRGTWVSPRSPVRGGVILYLHSGAHCYNPAAAMQNAALVAQASEARVFALDYRLTPEHPFPAQLQDALGAYEWLIDANAAPERTILVGASSGGNLALSLLIALRDERKPHPALAICLSPWTDLGNSGASMLANAKYDIQDKRMADETAGWYAGGESLDHPLISPLHADLHDLAPIYIQAGRAEAFIDMVEAFAEAATRQGAEVRLEVWPEMNHLFQAYGDRTLESRRALERIGEVVGEVLG